MSYQTGKKSKNIIKKFAALSLIVMMAAMVIPFGDFYTVNAASSINSASKASGASYTGSAALASKLDAVFEGKIGLSKSSSFKSTVSAPLGSSKMTSRNQYYIKNKTTGAVTNGWQCYIYANAVYNTLFNEYIGRAASLSHSKVLISGGSNKASYDQFSKAGVKCGAYMRTTTKSSGAYNGSAGHSLIVLSYNANNITYLEGNADGHGLVRIVTRTWADFNNNQLSGRSRYICHVVQPTETYYNSLYSATSGGSSEEKTVSTTAGNGTVSYSRVLSYKSSVMTGSDVKYVQTSLKALGYSVTVNGKFDSATQKAVKAFQKDHSLSVDGKCGSGTWKAIEKAVKAQTTDSAVAAASVTLTSVAVKNKPSKVTYTVGEKLNTSGLKLTATYSDKSTKAVTSGFACDVTTLNKVGTQKVTVTYNGKKTTFNVTVKAAALKITTQPVDSSAAIGGKVSFTVKAEGTDLSYQWQLSDDNGKTWRNSSIKKADYSTTLSKSNVNRQLRCVITDASGNKVTSQVVTMKKK